MKKPKIPKSELAHGNELWSKWTLWVEIPHSEACAAHSDLSYDPYEQVGLRQFKHLVDQYWELWSEETQEFGADLLGVFVTRWGGDYIDRAKKAIPLQNLLKALNEALIMEPPSDQDELLGWRKLIELLKTHEHCSSEATLEIVWGW